MKKLYQAGCALAILAITALASIDASAQVTLKVATGGPSGTYSPMYKELYGACKDDVSMVEQNTSGSNENVDLLVGNKVNAAFVQTDVLHLRARTENLANVKTLVALHPEEVHFIALSGLGMKSGGFLGYGSTKTEFTAVTQLAGLKLGAVGGSVTTAKLIKLLSDIPYEIVEYGKNEEMLGALKTGTIHVAVMVGGQPMSAVEALGAEFKLLDVPEATAAKLKDVYKPARLNYRKMGAAGIRTISTDALFVTREYKTPKMIESLSKFRACALSKVDELKETTGTHPKWQAVDASNHGQWPWYGLPESAAPAPAATPAAVPAKPAPAGTKR